MREDTERWRLFFRIASNLDVPLGTVTGWHLTTYELHLLDGEVRLGKFDRSTSEASDAAGVWDE